MTHDTWCMLYTSHLWWITYVSHSWSIIFVGHLWWMICQSFVSHLWYMMQATAFPGPNYEQTLTCQPFLMYVSHFWCMSAISDACQPFLMHVRHLWHTFPGPNYRAELGRSPHLHICCDERSHLCICCDERRMLWRSSCITSYHEIGHCASCVVVRGECCGKAHAGEGEHLLRHCADWRIHLNVPELFLDCHQNNQKNNNEKKKIIHMCQSCSFLTACTIITYTSNNNHTWSWMTACTVITYTANNNHTLNITHHTSYIIHQTSDIIHHTSYIIHHPVSNDAL